MPYNEIRDVEVWDGDVRTQVLVGGEGPPLLFLHPVIGLQWDPFVESLAAHHTVYAPYLPGTVPGDPDAHKPLEDVWDLTLCYSEILDALGLGGSPVAVVGHSFGGMLISPIGLWTDGRPWKNPNVISMEELAAAAFADPTGPVATAALALPEDPEALGEAIISITWTLGVAAKWWWPIPDRGLRKRIHRITADTLVVWGTQDGIISPEYAHDFGRLIRNCQVEMLPNAAHVAQLERFDVVPDMVKAFLAD